MSKQKSVDIMSLKLYIKWDVKSTPSKGTAEKLWIKDTYTMLPR